MSQENSPACLHHQPPLTMVLRTLHSDVTTPGQLTGLFECDECGDQRRLPLPLDSQIVPGVPEYEVA